MFYFLITLIAISLCLLVLLYPRWKARQRAQVKQAVFPENWRKILRHRVPYVRHMPADLQLQLKKLIQLFIAEKEFVGCAGIEINDEIKVTVAAQACLLLLNRKTDMYPKLRRILVYPGAFRVPHQTPDEHGLIHEGGRVLSGESWELGNVVLSWFDTLEGARTPDDGNNVVIHEFAHQLDQEKGRATGAPPLPKNADYPRWHEAFSAAFERVRQMHQRGEASAISRYGASSPAEFFAVASEVFFEQPEIIKSEMPEVYDELCYFYRVDPILWRLSASL